MEISLRCKCKVKEGSQNCILACYVIHNLLLSNHEDAPKTPIYPHPNFNNQLWSQTMEKYHFMSGPNKYYIL